MSSYDSIPTSHTPIVDSVESDSDCEVVEMKVKTISAGKAAVILVCAGCLAYVVVVCSGGAFTTTNMRGGDTTATTVLATAVTGTTEELTKGCVGFKHVCSGGDRGNCCAGYQCIGPVLFGMCTPSACVAEGEICAGFGQGNCCDGQCLAVMAPVPGPGRCAPYNCGEKGGGCTGFGRGSCCAGLTCKTNGLPGILSTCRL